MANYVIKEMPTGMGNGSDGKVFPKMRVYTEFDYDKVSSSTPIHLHSARAPLGVYSTP